MDADELVGRSALLANLHDAITAADADRGEAFLLMGEAGIGKTACLRVAASMARSAGRRVLRTIGHEAETNLAFAGLHRMLRPLLGLTDELPDVQRHGLLDAFGMGEGGAIDRFVVSIAAMNLLRLASRRCALLISADDVQWLDEETQHVLAFVARRLDPDVVIVAASTTAERAAGLRDSFRAVRLDRLSDTAANDLLTRRAPDLDEARRDWVMSNAVGNPLALIELAASPMPVESTAPGPMAATVTLSPALERTFGGRLIELAALGRDVVLIAAVAAHASLPEILAATARMSGQDVTPAVLEPAQVLGLLSVDERRVRFTHPLVKAAIVQSESISRRQRAHRALGSVITLNSRRRAWHRALSTACYDDGIADDLEATIAHSLRRGDVTDAIVALERAAQLSSRPVDRGRRLLLAARHAAQLGELENARRLLRMVDDDELSEWDQLRSQLLHEELDGIGVSYGSAVLQLCGAASDAAAAGQPDLALDLAIAAGRRRCEALLDGQARTELTRVAGILARTCGDARGVAVLALADPTAHGRAVLSMLIDIEDTGMDGEAASAYALAARTVGNDPLAARLSARAESEFRRRGLHGRLAGVLCDAADTRLDLGDWDGAAAALAELHTSAAVSASPHRQATVVLTEAKIAALRGRTAAALELVAGAEQFVAHPSANFRGRAQTVRGIAYLSASRYQDAYETLRRIFDPADPSHHSQAQYRAVGYLAEAAVHTGRQDDAREMIHRLRSVADVSGSPALSTQLAYAGALSASDDVAESVFLAGLGSEATSGPWPRARLQLAYGRWLRRQQRVTQSRSPLEGSLALFRGLGAVSWAQEALGELAAAGTEHEDRAVPGTVLTVQEAKIARLAADGLSNREISQQLCISPRTVGSHLYRIFPKLGVSSRAQLAARLPELAL
jgi:DNA-binding CsgD family transcriptional regulator/tetratricopeptide (TPR) repeat protein